MEVIAIDLNDRREPLVQTVHKYIQDNFNRTVQTIRTWLKINDEGQVSEMEAIKAASVFLSLGEDIAAHIFAHLNEEEIQALGCGIRKIHSIQEDQDDEILQEFFELAFVSPSSN